MNDPSTDESDGKTPEEFRSVQMRMLENHAAALLKHLRGDDPDKPFAGHADSAICSLTRAWLTTGMEARKVCDELHAAKKAASSRIVKDRSANGSGPGDLLGLDELSDDELKRRLFSPPIRGCFAGGIPG